MRLLEKAMSKAVIDTLENLAFMEVASAKEATREKPNQPIIAALLCYEPLQGEIRAIFPQELMSEVAATVFSLEVEDYSEATIQDVCAEILNTIAGRFLSELLPEHQVFRIGLPEIAGQQEIEENEDWQEWFFKTNGHHFSISLLNLTPVNFSTGDRFLTDCLQPVE